MTIYYNLYELRSKVRREELGGSESDAMEEAFYAFFLKANAQFAKFII